MWRFDETRLVALRESQGLTQQEFATRLGLQSRQQVQQWEKGGYDPSTKTLVKIANEFGVVPAYFYPKSEGANAPSNAE